MLLRVMQWKEHSFTRTQGKFVEWLQNINDHTQHMITYRTLGQNLNENRHQGIKEENIDCLNRCYQLVMFNSIYNLK